MKKYEDFVSKKELIIPETMQALIAKGKGFENLEIAEIPVPEITPDQLMARVDVAGVCTSILKLIEQGPEHTFIHGWDMNKWPVYSAGPCAQLNGTAAILCTNSALTISLIW